MNSRRGAHKRFVASHDIMFISPFLFYDFSGENPKLQRGAIVTYKDHIRNTEGKTVLYEHKYSGRIYIDGRPNI